MRRLICMLLCMLCACAAAFELVARPSVVAATVDSDTTLERTTARDGGTPAGGASPWLFGRATYYGDAPGDDLSAGACGFGDQVASDGVAAVADASPELNDGPPGASSPCGRCFELRCVPSLVPSESSNLPRCGACRRDAPPLVVRITDACPCKYAPNAASNKRWCCGDVPHFDLAAGAFDMLAASRAAGVLGIAFRRVPCAADAQRRNVTLRVAAAYAGASGELVVLDAAGAGGVVLLEVRAGGGDGSWMPLRRGWGATWQLPWPAAADGSVSVRVTAEDGAQLTLADVIAGPGALRAGALLRTDAQFEALPQPPLPPLGWPGPDDDLAPLLRCPPGAAALAAAAKAAQALVAAATGEAPPTTVPCAAAAAAAAAAPQLPAWCRMVPAAVPLQLRPAGCVAAAAAALAAQSCGDGQ